MSIGSLTKSANGIVDLAIVLGVGLVLLANFSTTTGVTGTTAQTTINTIITGLATYGNWVGLIVLIAVVVYLRKSYKSGDQG